VKKDPPEVRISNNALAKMGIYSNCKALKNYSLYTAYVDVKICPQEGHYSILLKHNATFSFKKTLEDLNVK
jgi:hypothetical protein